MGRHTHTHTHTHVDSCKVAAVVGLSLPFVILRIHVYTNEEDARSSGWNTTCTHNPPPLVGSIPCYTAADHRFPPIPLESPVG